MKEASGELNMTVVTIIAIAAIAAFLMTFLWPRIQNSISNQWTGIESTDQNLINQQPTP